MRTIDISKQLKPNQSPSEVSNAINNAIAELAGEGGGELFFPQGEYVCGSIELQDNTSLRLAKGALLKASTNIEDFFLDETVKPGLLRRYFIYALERKNVKVCGEGVIDGSGRAYWEDVFFSGRPADNPLELPCILQYDVLKPKPDRHVLIYFGSCSDIEVSGVTLKSSPSYTVWTVDCTDVIIDGVTLRNPRIGPNTDGLDIDCTERVKISNCDIDAGDDCIALKSDPNRRGNLRPCQDIEISNCTLSSSTCAIRLGYEGDAPMRKVRCHDCVMHDSRIGIDILSIRPDSIMKIEHGTPMDDIVFEDIVMRHVGQAFYIWCGNQPQMTGYDAHLRDVHFRRMEIDAEATSYIGGECPQAISGMCFEDITMTVKNALCIKDTENPDTTVPCHWSAHHKCGGLRFHGKTPALLSNVKVTCLQPGWPDIIIVNSNR